ncbi:unnamed protein product [Calypogeia fissa]
MDQLTNVWGCVSDRLGMGNVVMLSIVLALTVSTFWILQAHMAKKRKANCGLLFPPGRVDLPYFIWDTLAFVRCHSTNELKTFFDQKVAKYGPIFKMSIMGDTIVLLDPPAGNKFLLGSSEYKLVRKGYPKSMANLTVINSMLTIDEETQKVVRRQLLSKFFGPESLLRYVGKMERNVLDHLQKHWLGKEETGEEICTQSLITTFTFRLIAELCFGLNEKHKSAEIEKLAHVFQEWSDGMLSFPINLPGFAFHRALKAKAVLSDVVADLMASRRKELKEGTATPDQDLLSVLLSHVQPDDDGQVWTDTFIRENLVLFLYAGHDTTAATLTMTISDIAKHPEVYTKLIEEHKLIAVSKQEGEPLKMDDLKNMTYTWQVVQESMRQTTIIPLGYRQVTRDFQYNGYTIRKGWKIFWSQDRTNRHPAFFDDPDKYEPSRFSPSTRPGPYVFLPFGAGSRICPGMEFAKTEILIFLHHFLMRFKWSLVDPDEKVIRVYMPRTKKGSPIRITKV